MAQMKNHPTEKPATSAAERSGTSFSSVFTRGLALALCVMALGGCFRPRPLGTGRAVTLWRDVQREAGPSSSRQTSGAATSAGRIDLKRALSMVSRDNLSLQALRARADQARAAEGEATQLENPELRVRNVEIDRIAEDRARVDVGLRVPIPHPWLFDARSRRAKLETARYRARVDRARVDLIAQVKAQFATLASLTEQEAQASKTIDLLTDLVALVDQRLAAGEATRVDQATARLRHAGALDRLAAVQAERSGTVGRLRRLLGVRPGTEVQFASDSVSMASSAGADAEPKPKTLIQQALRRRPELREAAAQVELARAGAYIARAQRVPWLRFAEVNYGFAPGLDPLNFDVALAVELPLLSWNLGAVATEDARVARRETEERGLVMALAQQVSRACVDVGQSGRRLRELERAILPTLSQTSAVLREATQSATLDPLDVIRAEVRRAGIVRRHLTARLRHTLARIELDRLVGKE